VKKTILLPSLLFSVFFFLNGCAFLSQKKLDLIQWPADIYYIEAVCELNIAWNNTQYSGDMSIKLDYPDMLFLEVYGPFGDTIFSIQKNRDSFVMLAGNDKITSEKQFIDLFKMTINDFIDDISIKGTRQQGLGSGFYIQKEQYRVTYALNNREDKMCWINPDGTMCIRFIEAKFDKGQSIGKGSN
jgi:hypothetical protein